MTKDNFTLVIVFFPNCWNDSVPKVGIYLDGELLAVEHLYKNQDIIKFEYEIELDYGSHEISVKYENKTVQVDEEVTGKDFAAGTYFVNVFDKNSELVSKTSFTLR